MAILEEISDRRSYRRLSTRPIPGEILRDMLTAGGLAMSCYNNQPWRFVAATGPELEAVKASLAEGNQWASRAPLIIGVATKPGLDCRLDEGRDYALFDTGAATMALALQAVHDGLVAHPIAGYNVRKAKAALGIPKDYVLITLVIVGYPSEDDSLLSDWQKERETGPRERKPLEEVAFIGRWPADIP